jgi:hypothetical protein
MIINFIKRWIRLIRLNRFNSFVNKRSQKLSTQQIDELIEINKDALARLGDNADYDGMGNYGRFPPIEKIVKKRKLHEK